MKLPHEQITKISNNRPPAIPKLWNDTYTEIDENFAAISTSLGENKKLRVYTAKEFTLTENPLTNLNPSDDIKVGDVVLGPVGKIYTVSAVEADKFTLTATEYSFEGIVQFASEEEVQGGLVADKAVSPATLQKQIDQVERNVLDTKGVFETLEDLKRVHPSGEDGDLYLVGKNVYGWSTEKSDWLNMGTFRGPQGSGLNTEKETFDNVEALKAKYPTGTEGQFFVVGDKLYTWQGGEWKEMGAYVGPSGGYYVPSMDGTQLKFTKQDKVEDLESPLEFNLTEIVLGEDADFVQMFKTAAGIDSVRTKQRVNVAKE